jgi:hypothetical protein
VVVDHTCRSLGGPGASGILNLKAADMGPGPRLLRGCTVKLYVAPRVAMLVNVNRRCRGVRRAGQPRVCSG